MDGEGIDVWVGTGEGKNYKMISSDLLRAKHTTDIVSKYLKIDDELNNVLRESNLGEAVKR